MQESPTTPIINKHVRSGSMNSVNGNQFSGSTTELEPSSINNMLALTPISHSRKPSRVQIMEEQGQTALTDRPPCKATELLGPRISVKKNRIGIEEPENKRMSKRSILRNSTTIGIGGEAQIMSDRKRGSNLLRKSTLYSKDNLSWEDIFGKFLKDIGVNLQMEKSKEKRDIFNNNPFLRNIPMTPKIDYFKDEYMRNLEDYLNGDVSMQDLINNNNFPSLTRKKIQFENFLKSNNKTGDGLRKPTLKEIRMALNKINDLEKHGKTNIPATESKLMEVTSPRSPNKTKSLTNLGESAGVTTDKLRLAVMNNILTGKINERRELIHDKKKESIREVKLFKNFYNISSDYMSKIKNRNLIQDQQQEGNMFSLRNTLKLKNHVILTEDSSKHMLSTASSNMPDMYNHNKKLFKKYLHNKVFTSSDDYLDILQEYKKFSQEFRRRIINPGLLDGVKRSESAKGNEDIQEKKAQVFEEDDKIKGFATDREIPQTSQEGRKKVFTRKTFSSTDMALTDFLYNSQVMNNQKAGMMPPVGLPDVFNDGDNEQMRTSCLKFKKDAEKTRNRDKKDYFRDIGRLKRKGGGSERIVESKSVNLRRNQVLKVPEFDIHDDMSDDDCLPSLTEQTLDHLYSQSIHLQRNIMKRNKEGFHHRMKQLIKLEDIMGQSIKVNKVKLKVNK